MNLSTRLSVISVIMVLLGLMIVSSAAADNGNPNPGILPIQSTPYNGTYGDWSTENRIRIRDKDIGKQKTVHNVCKMQFYSRSKEWYKKK